ncbi:MAG: class I adenylate-forming enzyme family protein [Reyranellaceae bacterium]
MQTLAEMLRTAARLVPDRNYIVSDAGTLSFAQFDRQAAKLANVLRDLGIGKGDVVGLYLPSVPMLAIGYFACQKLGAVAAPMSAMLREREVSNVAGRTGMRALLTSGGETFDVVRKVRAAGIALESVLVLGEPVEGGLDLRALMQAANDGFEDVPCRPEDTAALFFTSGTTGEPKGAMQTQGSLYATLRDMAVYNGFRWSTETLMCALPLFNNFGATCMMNLSMFVGGTMLHLERWDTERVLELITRHKATYMAGSPTMFVYLLRAFDRRKHDLSGLKIAVTGGAPVAPSILAQFRQEIGTPLLQIYGATEVSGYVVGEPPFGVQKPGSTGTPIGGTIIDVVDDDGRPVPTGAIGEVRVQGDVVGGGYWSDAETTRKVFTAQGWLSGDLGYLDEQGYLFIVDRKKDVIISGGFNVYPLEVEDLLYTHPAVAVCAVIGLPDADKGELPVAVLVPKPGEKVARAEIIEFCRQRISAYKAPRDVYSVDEMPLGPSGKILKRTLREWAAQGRLQRVS